MALSALDATGTMSSPAVGSGPPSGSRVETFHSWRVPRVAAHGEGAATRG
ncbi:hypothetical protein P1S61_16075 [Streptomyces sp. ME08-AFT2]|nr:hypothetical protein [Streptomyces sp. ME08-AFT2]MDX3310578.1 hypothetical protein [Streptomyces sp. ME08-AFT2]